MIINFLKVILLSVLVSICMYTDFKENKIKNKYLAVAFIAGLALSLCGGGLNELKDSLLGTVIPFIAFILFFALNMFGSGDIKLFCVIGSIMGARFVINNIFYSFIACFILIIIYLIIKKRLIKYVAYLFYQLKALIFLKGRVTKSPIEKTRFPFAGAIFAGTIAQLILKYNFI